MNQHDEHEGGSETNSPGRGHAGGGACVEFVEALYRFGTGFGEILVVPFDGPVEEIFFPLPLEPGKAEELLHQYRNESRLRRNISLALNPRIRRQAGNVYVEHIVAVAADVDGDALPGLPEKLALLEQVGCPATALIHSGHGCHPYFMLTEPVRYADLPADSSEMLADFLGTGHAFDRNRLLGLPGTINWGTAKKPKQPAWRTIVSFDPNARIAWQKLLAGLDALGVQRKPIRLSRPKSPTPTSANRQACPLPQGPKPALPAEGLWDHDRELIESGHQEADDFDGRSEADASASFALVRAGLADFQIEHVFARYAIGEKYREKQADGPRYLARTIAAARRLDLEMYPRECVPAVVTRCRGGSRVRLSLRPGAGRSAGFARTAEVPRDGPSPLLDDLAAVLAAVQGEVVSDPRAQGIWWERLDGWPVMATLVVRPVPYQPKPRTFIERVALVPPIALPTGPAGGKASS